MNRKRTRPAPFSGERRGNPRRFDWRPHPRRKRAAWAYPWAGLLLAGVLAIGAAVLWPREEPRERGSAQPVASSADTLRAHFSLCHGATRVTCVVDGDTIWFRGQKIRIADIDAPEVSEPRCARELEMGKKATARLQELLNAGAFRLEAPSGRERDKYGRALRYIFRGNTGLGDLLVEEGLAEQWGGPRIDWC